MAVFMVKCWPEHFGLIRKVVELVKAHLLYILVFMQILPYTYSNPKTAFMAYFMFKCWSEEFDIEEKL